MKVTVATCPGYRRLMIPFLRCFYHAWPTCPWPMEIIGATGEDRQWASNMLYHLTEHPREPFLLLLEDYWLTDVDEPVVVEAARMVESGEAHMIRLAACPGPTLPHPDQRFGVFSPLAQYALSLQASIWSPGALADLIEPGWNPWQVEILGSRKVEHTPFRFVGTAKYAINYHNAALRGKINPVAVEYAESLL